MQGFSNVQGMRHSPKHETSNYNPFLVRVVVLLMLSTVTVQPLVFNGSNFC